MPSVTKRIEKCYQPFGGYVPVKLFTEKQYADMNDVVEVPSAYKAIQGLVVDYLTRFMFTQDKISSFVISINGAKCVDRAFENDTETRNVMGLLDKVTGLDDTSIYSACRIVGYDVAIRRGVNWFRPVSEIIPPKELISNIRVMVNRCLTFLNEIGPIVSAGFTFEGGYTELIDSGDGDYLTKDTLIDLKTSYERLSSKWSLQLLVYYIMGIHSINKEFESVEKLCIYNPIENKSYIVKISNIDDKSKYEVSNKVIGYKMAEPARYYDYKKWRKVEDYSTWREIDGQDRKVIVDFIRLNHCTTGFNVDAFADGIYDITVDDYWTYYRKIYKYGNRPLFTNTEIIKLIKHNGFIMFISVSGKGVKAVLNGASRRITTHSVEYFYDNIDKYAKTVLALFSGYWKALYSISEQIQSLTPSEKYLRESYAYYLFRSQQRVPITFIDWYNTEGFKIKPEGTVHGCIVDIDTTKHIYLNPYDGGMTSYSAPSMYDKTVYLNTLSLIANERPDLLESLQKKKESTDNSLFELQNRDLYMLLKPDDMISTEVKKEYDTSMYDTSKRMYALQFIYTHNLVKVWYDDVLEKYGDKITKEEFLALIETETDE